MLFRSTYVQNVITCVEDVRIHVEGLVIKPLASSLGALTNEEMRIGTVSLSIGGGSTDLILYQAGRPFKIRSPTQLNKDIQNTDLSKKEKINKNGLNT